MTPPQADAPAVRPESGEGGVEVIVEDSRWDALGLPVLAERAVAAALRRLGLEPGRFSVAILATGDDEIARLNASFRGRAAPTNVLSWPAVERRAARAGAAPRLPAAGEEELGDIALAFDTCMREAGEQGIAPADHVTHLVVHGLLHLLGYDHERDADATLMEGLETAILAELGLPDPYEERAPEGP